MTTRAPRRRQASLALGYLSVHSSTAVPLDGLADACWPGGRPKTWAASLRRVLSDLRAWLRASGASADVATAQGTCRLQLAGDLLDTDEARVLVGRGSVLTAHERLVALRRAEALTRDDLLPGLEAPFLDDARRLARAQRQSLLEALSDAERRFGDADAAVAAALEVVGTDRLRESGYRLAMAAHYHAGRAGAALRIYEDCRRALVEELGAQPSTETVMLYDAILRGTHPGAAPDEGTATGLPAAARYLAAIRSEEQIVALEAQLTEVELRPDSLTRRLDLMIELGRAYWATRGRAAKVMEFALAAGEGALAAGSPSHVAAALNLLAANTGVGRTNGEAERICTRALEAFGTDPLVRARVATLRAEMRSGEEAISLGEAAVDAARASRNADAQLDAVITLDRSLAWTADIERRLALAVECNGLLGSGVSPWRVRPTYESATRAQIGDVRWLADEAARLDRAAVASGHWEPAFYAMAYKATTALLAGNTAPAEAMAEESLALAKSDINAVNAASGLLMAVARERGDLPALLPAIEAIAAAEPVVGAFVAAHALARVVVGQHETAADTARRLTEDGLAGVERDLVWLLSLGALAEALALVGVEAPLLRDTAAMNVVLDLLDPYAGQVCAGAHGIVILGSIDTFRGMLLVARDELDAAEAALAAGSALERRMPAPLLQARTDAWLGYTVARQGDAARAAMLFAGTAAVAAFDGRDGLADIARRMEVGANHGVSRAPASPTS